MRDTRYGIWVVSQGRYIGIRQKHYQNHNTRGTKSLEKKKGLSTFRWGEENEEGWVQGVGASRSKKFQNGHSLPLSQNDPHSPVSPSHQNCPLPLTSYYSYLNVPHLPTSSALYRYFVMLKIRTISQVCYLTVWFDSYNLHIHIYWSNVRFSKLSIVLLFFTISSNKT